MHFFNFVAKSLFSFLHVERQRQPIFTIIFHVFFLLIFTQSVRKEERGILVVEESI